MSTAKISLETRVFNIVEHGAKADGKTVNTKAIQAAIDACGAAGGGTVVVPAGTFVTGTIWLRSHVELHLQHGAVLLASPNQDDYNKEDAYPQNWGGGQEDEWNATHLILAVEVENVAVTGTGVIDGNGRVFFEEPKLMHYSANLFRDGVAMAKDKKRLRPGQLMVFCESRNIRLRDFTIRDTPSWSIFLYGSDDIQVRGLMIRNQPTGANTDGIDIDCCRNVTVSDCNIDTGDDAITLRAAPHSLKDKTRVCENIIVNNCVLASSGGAFRIGVGNGIIRNAVLSNIMITRAGWGVFFCSAYRPKQPGVSISNITVRDVYVRNTAHPLVISMNTDDATAPMEDIVIDGFHAEGFAGSSLFGSAHSRPTRVRLRNADFTVVPRPDTKMKPDTLPETLLSFVGADDLRLENVRVTWKTTDKGWIRALAMRHCTGVSISEDCRLAEPPPPAPAPAPAAGK